MIILVVRKPMLRIFFWDGNSQKYKFDKYKTNLKNKHAKISHRFPKEIKSFTESYSFIRDLINTPANFLGPNEILKATKKFLTNYKLVNVVSGEKLKKKFPLIFAVGQGADEKKNHYFVNLS